MQDHGIRSIHLATAEKKYGRLGNQQPAKSLRYRIGNLLATVGGGALTWMMFEVAIAPGIDNSAKLFAVLFAIGLLIPTGLFFFRAIVK